MIAEEPAASSVTLYRDFNGLDLPGVLLVRVTTFLSPPSTLGFVGVQIPVWAAAFFFYANKVA